VVAIIATAWPVVAQGLAHWDSTLLLGAGLGAAFVAAGYHTIMTSRTGIDEERVYQTGLLAKEMPIRTITQVRLVHVPGLRWLIVPRLVAKAGGLRTLSFPTADLQVLQTFRELAYGRQASDPAQGGGA
ncbi:MAG: hypothetical protein RL513_475, partial [Pseudomonadota bacterium]